ncbi:MAG: InlB B-repeat-containing protein [Treponema sp.]|nr:InlB B-repeat-containing protein [Treponema sp.]
MKHILSGSIRSVFRHIVFLSVPVLIFAATGCSQTLDTPAAAGTDASACTVHISVTRSAGRTVIYTDGTVTTYVLSGAPAGSTQNRLTTWNFYDSIPSITLAAGTPWDFTLNAYDGSGSLVLSGTKNGVSLVASTTISFVLYPPDVSGTGAVNIYLNWPIDRGITSATVSFNGSSPSAIDSSRISMGNYAYQNTQVSSGDYPFVLKLYSGNLLAAAVTEVVCIRSGLTSSKTINLTSSEINSVPAAPSGLTAAAYAGTTDDTTNGTVSFTWTDNSIDETGFELECRDQTAADWTVVNGSIAPGTKTCTAAVFKRGRSYVYRIRAVNSFGTSDWSESLGSTIPWLVTFDPQNGSADTFAECPDYSSVPQPDDPVYDGYKFGGWYTDTTYTTQWYFSDPVTKNMTLYAKWYKDISVTISVPQGSSVTFSGTTTAAKGDSLTVSITETYTAYQWYLDGNELSGSTGQSVTVTSSIVGTHALTVFTTDSAGEVSSATLYFTVTQ